MAIFLPIDSSLMIVRVIVNLRIEAPKQKHVQLVKASGANEHAKKT